MGRSTTAKESCRRAVLLLAGGMASAIRLPLKNSAAVVLLLADGSAVHGLFDYR